MSHLSRNLQILRKKLGVNQDKMIDYVGVKGGTWSDYERGKTEPSVETIILISEFFKVSIERLLKEDVNEDVNLTVETKNTEKVNLKVNAPVNLNPKKPKKESQVEDEPVQYGKTPDGEIVWRDKYIALLEKKILEFSTAGSSANNLEAFATRLLALQEFVLERAADAPGATLDQVYAELGTKETAVRKQKNKDILSDGNK